MTLTLPPTAAGVPLASPQTSAGRERLRQQLRGYLAAEPQKETAWYGLSLVAEDPAEALECLVRTLEIRAAGSSLPGGQARVGARLRALAAQVERRPVGPFARVVGLVGQALTAALIVILALVIGPMALGARTVIILSGSMRPVIQPGSAVIARPVPAESLKVGDVIVFAPNANAVIPKVHRILSIRVADGVRYYTTRGDANGSSDPDEVSLGGTGWKVWYSVPLVGYAVAWGSSRAGNVALIALPLLGLVGLMAWDWWRKKQLG
jgi:signal peptidase I